MLVGDKYRPDLIAGDWDAIVVGSGMGGLATAALLATRGARVLVLERHFTAGGFTHSFTRHGFEWDVGLHYIGSLGNEASSFRRLFDTVTDGAVTWAPMETVYDQIHIADRAYDFPAGRDRFRDTLIGYFPRERGAIDAYLELVRKVQRASRWVFAPKGLPRPLAAALEPARKRLLRRDFGATTGAVLASLTDDAELRAVLAGQWGDYGLPPGRSSFGIHALVAGHYMSQGGFYPAGGGSAIAAGAARVIERTGGAVIVRAGVERILVERGRVAGVRLEDGNEIRARTVVSAAGLATTLGTLLTGDQRDRLKARRTLDAAGPSMGHACLYVGIDGDDAALGLSTTNLWLYPGPDHDANVARFAEDGSAPDPVHYISFPSAKDPSWPARYPGKATVEVIGGLPYAHVAEWRDQPWRKRGNAYNAAKAEIAERYLAALIRHRPQVEGRIAHYELSTPLTTEHFTSHPRGAMYGLDHSPARFLNDRVFPRTEIPGLYLTGQDVLSVGVSSALTSGAMTAAAILGWRGLGAMRRWLG